MSKFTRPENLSFPQVYYNFSARDKGGNDAKIVNYRVQDILVEDFDYAVEILLKFYLPEEPLCCGRNFSEKSDDVEYMGNFYKSLLLDRLSIGCYKDGTNELVGVNIMDVKSSDDIESHEVYRHIYKHFISSSHTIAFCLSTTSVS